MKRAKYPRSKFKLHVVTVNYKKASKIEKIVVGAYEYLWDMGIKCWEIRILHPKGYYKYPILNGFFPDGQPFYLYFRYKENQKIPDDVKILKKYIKEKGGYFKIIFLYTHLTTWIFDQINEFVEEYKERE